MTIRTCVLTVLGIAAMHCGAATANPLYRCTDATGFVLLTSDAGAARVCTMLSQGKGSAKGNRCDKGSCTIRITKDTGGHYYINGTSGGTAIRYPVDTGASAMTICIRGQCASQEAPAN
jgi:hypothetical protein